MRKWVFIIRGKTMMNSFMEHLSFVTAGRQQSHTSTVDIFELTRLGQYDQVKTALESNRALVNCKDDRGHTLLIFALYHNKLNIAKYLIALGADLTTPDVVYGHSAMQYIKQMHLEGPCGIPMEAGGDTAHPLPPTPATENVSVMGANFEKVEAMIYDM
jgi:hypothetical protein